jgi:glycosyltransferase involved in cell wall biosynthesis
MPKTTVEVAEDRPPATSGTGGNPTSGRIERELGANPSVPVSSFPPFAVDGLDVTILMPCLNETRTLPACIVRAREALQILRDEHGLTGEVLISDNGSDDGSVEIAESLGARVVRCEVRGYGAALRFGTLSARGRYIVMGDADSSYDFCDAIPMIEKLELGYEFCMGSRFAGAILPGAMPWKNRHVGNPLLTWVLNLFFRSGFSDAHCGLRALTMRAFLEINPTSSGMEYASEMVIKAALLDCRRTEVPVVLSPDGRDRAPHLKPFRDGWRHLRYLIMLSPAWLYLIPGLALVSLGVTIFSLLITRPPGEIAAVGPVWFGDHWMVLAMGMTVSGYLSVLFAMAATLVGIRNGYRRVTRALFILYRCSRLESLLGVSLFFVALGASIIGDVAWAWAGQHFGALNMERQMIVGTTALILGVQSFFAGFLLSVIAGNEGDIEKAVIEAGRVRSSSAPARLPRYREHLRSLGIAETEDDAVPPVY